MNGLQNQKTVVEKYKERSDELGEKLCYKCFRDEKKETVVGSKEFSVTEGEHLPQNLLLECPTHGTR